jgi:hypothetical protein
MAERKGNQPSGLPRALVVNLGLWLVLFALQGALPPWDGFVPAHVGAGQGAAATGPVLARLIGPVVDLIGRGALRYVYWLMLVAAPVYSAWMISRIWSAPPAALTANVWMLCVASAALLGAIAVFDLPYLSNDVYLYRAQGQLVQAGHNPYLAAPAKALPPDQLVNVPWKTQRSPYGPLALWMFWLCTDVVSSVGAQVWLLKVLMALPWLIAARWVVFSRRLAQPDKVKWLAWVGLSPLVLLEVCQNSHLEGWMGLLVLGSVLAMQRGALKWTALAGLLLGLACAIKPTAAVAGVVMVAWLTDRPGDGRTGTGRLGAAVIFVVMAAIPLALAGGPFWAGMATLGGLREESAKILRSLYFVLMAYLEISPRWLVWLSLLGNLAAMAAGISVSRRTGSLAKGLVVCLLVQAILGRTFLQPWYFAALVLVAMAVPLPAPHQAPRGLRRMEGAGQAKFFCVILLAGAGAIGGAYAVMLSVGPAVQSLSFVAMVILPVAAGLIWLVDPRARLGPPMRPKAPAPSRPREQPRAPGGQDAAR